VLFSWPIGQGIFGIQYLIDFLSQLRVSEVHGFYNLQLFYWHFLEILWLFIFLVFYSSSLAVGHKVQQI